MQPLTMRCPYCFRKMKVRAITCGNCEMEIRGNFVIPDFLDLSADQQRFALDFVLLSGSLKDLAQKYGVSYPTVRARLDRLIEALRSDLTEEEKRRASVLDAIEDKRLSADEGAALLRRTSSRDEREKP